MVTDRPGTSTSAPSHWIKFNIWCMSANPPSELRWGQLNETHLARREENTSFSEDFQIIFQSDPLIILSPLTKLTS